MDPTEAALQAAPERSASPSSQSSHQRSIAVFIPLLLMGGIVGRLFREFAMTVSHHRPRLRRRLPHPHTHDVLPLPQAPPRRAHGLPLQASSSAIFDGLLNFYRRTLDVALKLPVRHPHASSSPRMGVTGLPLPSIIPKGFFPNQDNGRPRSAPPRPAQDVSFSRNGAASRSRIAAAVVGKDPAVAGLFLFSIGAGLGGQTGNNGRIWVTLKPFEDQRTSNPPSRSSARLRRRDPIGIPGMIVSSSCRPPRTSTSAAASPSPNTSSPFRTRTSTELFEWTPPHPREDAPASPCSAICHHRPAGRRHHRHPHHRPGPRRPASASSPQVRSTTRSTTPSASARFHAVLHPAQHLPPHPRGSARHAGRPLDTLEQALREIGGRDGTAVPLSTFVHRWTPAPVLPLAISHQSQFPVRHPLLQPRRRRRPRPGRGRSVNAGPGRAWASPTLADAAPSRGTAQAFQSSLASSEPYLDRRRHHRRLHHPRRPIRELHPAPSPSSPPCPRPASAPS